MTLLRPPRLKLERTEREVCGKISNTIAYPELIKPLSEIVRTHVERAMILCLGNRNLAARQLGISRATLYRYLKSYGAVLGLPHT